MLWRFIGIVLGFVALLVARRVLIKRQLPAPPWRMPTAALLLLAFGDGLISRSPVGSSSLLLQLDKLAGGYALVTLLGWALLELPPALGWGRPMPRILKDLLLLSISAVITVLALQEARVNLVGLVTTSAVLTAVVGLAAQETLKDLFGGLSMQIGSPFKEGDWVDLGSGRGRVVSITLMNTVLSTLEGSNIVVPNSQAASAIVRRFKTQEPCGNRFTIGLDYSHPPAQALRLLQDILDQHPDVMTDPAPRTWIGRYGESSIEYELLAFQREAGEGDRYRVRSELLEQIWYALNREQHQIPFPVMEVQWRDPKSRATEGPSSDHKKDREEHLAKNPLFSCLTASERGLLAELTRCIQYGPGETIVREGARGDCLYQVISGGVSIWKNGVDSHTKSEGFKVADLGPNEIFGEMSVFTNEPRNATVRANTEATLLEIERRDIAPLLKANPSLYSTLGELVSSRQQALDALDQTSQSEQSSWLIHTMRQLFENLV